jgi:hypothetical protein
MTLSLDELRARIVELEGHVEAELETRREQLRYHIERGRAIFDRETNVQHRALRTRLLGYVFGSRLLVVLTAPFIYALIVPFVLLDLFISLYQAVCFPVYGIEKVRRADHIVFDRHLLGYLNLVEKLNCVYCGYGNGLLSYAREIAARTEQYWCPIKHARRMQGAHERQAGFLDFGDAEGWRDRLEEMRKALAKADP